MWLRWSGRGGALGGLLGSHLVLGHSTGNVFDHLNLVHRYGNT